MPRTSPLRNLHEHAEGVMLPFPAGDAGPVDLVATYGELELEYAAIRRGCALFDMAQRATIAVRGDERHDFLNRMLTQELKGVPPHRCVRSFWLSRKGRVDADLRVLILPDRVLLDLDAHSAARTLQTLGAYIITEDVALTDESDAYSRIALHGPRAPGLLAEVATHTAGAALAAMSPGEACEALIGGCAVVIDRQDALGEAGFELLVGVKDAEAVWLALLRAGAAEDGGAAPHRLRPAGWHAYNIARVEAGWPLFMIDFATNSLPHETGVLHDRVSFKKGCYLGQEVVARMEARGAGKQILAAIKLEPAAGGEHAPRQPITGEAVFDAESPDATPVGAVTSSVLSPMLGDTPVCFAQMKRSHSAPGTKVSVEAQGSRMRGAVHDGLAFHKRA